MTIDGLVWLEDALRRSSAVRVEIERLDHRGDFAMLTARVKANNIAELEVALSNLISKPSGVSAATWSSAADEEIVYVCDCNISGPDDVFTTVLHIELEATDGRELMAKVLEGDC